MYDYGIVDDSGGRNLLRSEEETRKTLVRAARAITQKAATQLVSTWEEHTKTAGRYPLSAAPNLGIRPFRTNWGVSGR